LQRGLRLYVAATRLIDLLQPLFALAIRIYLARGWWRRAG